MANRSLKEFDVVAVLCDLPAHNLTAGDVGAIVYCYHHPATAYEVEFLDASGKTKAVVTLEASQLLKLNWTRVAAAGGS